MSVILEHAIDIREFFRCRVPETECDKIWGLVEIDGASYTFWGRWADPSSTSNRQVLVKRLVNTERSREIAELKRRKTRQGYQEIDCSRTADGDYLELERLYAGLVESLWNNLRLAHLGSTLRSRSPDNLDR